MKKRTLYSILAGLAILVIILLVLKSKGIIGKGNGIEVAVDTATYKNIIETVSASGKIYPEVEVKVSSDVSGEIVELPVKEGDSVTKGQEVAKIYADIYNSIRQRSAASVAQSEAQYANVQASLGSYKAVLDQQEAAYRRNKQLYQKRVISQQDFEQSESSYQSALANYKAAEDQVNALKFALQAAKADLSQAVDNLHRTTITAPMSGYVTYLPLKKGERVVGTAQMAGTEIMSIANMKVMEAQVDVGENDIQKVFLGDTAIVEVDAYNDRKFKGIVTQIASSSGDMSSSSASSSNSSAQQVTNYTVHIRLLKDTYQDLIDPKHPEHFPFRPGMSTNVDIQTERKNHVLSVPINAVTTRQLDSLKSVGTTTENGIENEVVFLVKPDNTVHMQEVSTGIQDENNIEILSGLKAGDRVVTAPYTAISKTLKDGSQIRVVSKEKLYSAP